MSARNLHIASDLALPADVVTSTQVVYGGKGMGKTNFGSVLVEEMTKSNLHWSVLDPMGVWWGVRHDADGKRPGIKCLILGGAHGDIPIEPTGGDVVADLVIDEQVNTIIDFSRRANGKMWSKGERIRFVTDYATRLFERQGELIGGAARQRREPLHQFLDESARYIPQTIPSGAQDIAKCVGAWEQIVEEGRNIGLGVTFLTQRSARMNKSVSELADVMYAFRTFGPNSLAAIMDWLGEHVEKSKVREYAEQVRRLDVGATLVVSPGWLDVEKIAHIRARETFDSSATPRPGQRARRVTGKAATPDLAKYQARMTETIERARLDDPRELRKLLSDRDREIKALRLAATTPTKSTEMPHAVAKAVLDTTKRARSVGDDVIHALVRDVKTANINALGTITDAINSAAARAETSLREQLKAPVTKTITPPLMRVASINGQSIADGTAFVSRGSHITVRATPPSVVVTNGDVTSRMHRVLSALAELDAFGVTQPTRKQVGIFAGRDLSGGQPAKDVGACVQQGLVAIPGVGLLALTAKGKAIASTASLPTSLDELHERARSRLSSARQINILNYLLGHYPTAMSRREVGVGVGADLSGGQPAKDVGKLVTLDFATIPGVGLLRASDLLFPERLA